MTITEQMFDKDHHNIGEIKLVEDNKYVTIEINGQYFHHFLKTKYEVHGINSLSEEYVITEKKGEYPIINLHLTDENNRERILRRWTKITKLQLGKPINGLEDVDIEGEEVTVEPPPDADIETKKHFEILKYWVVIARKHHNVTTDLYDKDGNEIGGIEEGLDFFFHSIMYTKICPFIKIWHFPKKNMTQVFGRILHPDIILDLEFVMPTEKDNERGDED